ncbi:MAG: hypothetical protein COA52_05450 [Hyphomicrobiales bacterium]|nr:DUF3291 domain-containing protein [Hyphomicrobiales bacterium]PCJ94306.1 MAG: hypothetical protein COA52_05450 [Hyphomicrobiales bacterium]
MTKRLALYNFGVFRQRAENPINDAWRDFHDPIMALIEKAPGFIARSGYDGDPGPHSWGTQVYPRFYEERGDGWSPATLSLWQDLEFLFQFTYFGLHQKAFVGGKKWFERGGWPPYVLWWVEDDHTPDWAEGVLHFEHLHDHGPTAKAFNFKKPFDAAGLQTSKPGKKSSA